VAAVNMAKASGQVCTRMPILVSQLGALKVVGRQYYNRHNSESNTKESHKLCKRFRAMFVPMP
jgi:hypothetical protein